MVRRLVQVLAVSLLTLAAARASSENTLIAAVAVALKSGDAANADALATRALGDSAITPQDRARALLNRGLAREQLGRREEAMVDYTEALQLSVLVPGDRARALFDRGVTLDELGRTIDAIGDYTAALKLNPNFAPALNNRANAYSRRGKLEEAKRDYNASLAASNTQPEFSMYGLGQIAEKQGDAIAAQDWYKKALRANPNYTLASQRLAALGDFAAPVLKPPARVLAKNDAAPIVLHPPAGRASEEDAAVPTGPKMALAAYEPPSDVPDLRPAIDEAVTGTSSADVSDTVPPSSARAAVMGATQIQLGAWRSEGEAAEGWNHIAARAGNLLDGMTPQIVVADIPGKGRYWRLRADPAGLSASDLCAKLLAQGVACIAVK